MDAYTIKHAYKTWYVNHRSCFKTPSQAQYQCWDKGFNTQNTQSIPALESLVPP